MPIDQLFERLAQVGEGTYGKVYKAKCKKTGNIVALKKIRMETEKEGFPVTAAREIKLLKSMNHPNIVKLQSISASSAESVYLVFEYLDFDLAGLLYHLGGTSLSIARVKCIIRQLLVALHYLHSHGVVHRDIKCSNVLISRDGQVKLADFGLAKVFRHPDRTLEEELICNRMMTNRVITLWYRPPEVLLGSTDYGPEVDIWGIGCILLDLINGKSVFTGQDEISQLDLIVKKLGPITSSMKPLTTLPWYSIVMDHLQNESNHSTSSKGEDFLENQFGKVLGPSGIDLLRQLLCLIPSERITAAKGVNHPWFTESPLPVDYPQLIPEIDGDWHEFQCKQRRKQVDLASSTSSKV